MKSKILVGSFSALCLGLVIAFPIVEGLFLSSVLIAFVLGVTLLTMLIKSNYKNRDLTFVVIGLALSLGLAYPLGNQPIQSPTMTQEEIDEQYYEEVIKPLEDEKAKEMLIAIEKAEAETAENDKEIDNSPKMNKESLQQLNKGMTYEEVVKIVGKEDKENSETLNSDGTGTIGLVWEGETDGIVLIFFSINGNSKTLHSYTTTNLK